MKKIGLVAFLLVVSLLLYGCGSSTVEIYAFLDETLSLVSYGETYLSVMEIPEVLSARCITPEEAWDAFMEDHAGEAGVAGLEAGDLRGRIIVTVKEADAEQVAEQLAQIDGVVNVTIQKAPSLLVRIGAWIQEKVTEEK